MGHADQFATRMCAMVHLNQLILQRKFQRGLLHLVLRQILLQNNSFVDVQHVLPQSGILMPVMSTLEDATLAAEELSI